MQSGFLCVNKPTGMTSFEVVSLVKKKLGTKRVGHLGTIDKAGAGVLPIAVGRATKFFDHFLSKDKTYLAIFRFGEETDTLDSYGTITNKNSVNVTLNELKEASKKFVGHISQTPPSYSAVKVGGKRASDIVHSGGEVELKSRDVVVFSFDVLEMLEKNLFLVKIHCSAGTYIRSIVRDIAHVLGTFGTMVAIIRTQSGAFEIENSILPEEIDWENVVPISSVVKPEELESDKLKKLLENNND